MWKPSKPGFYWARWMKASEGTHEGEELAPALDWEIVEVWENHIGDECEADAAHGVEKFAVSVCGVREAQWLRDFIWLEAEPLAVP
ncbi:MAG TPA: hypothetical protein VM529_08045 [Gemmata sp.]|jgi:hypothetical protein|nr:hypothetical protein [Gemmata sp.]